MNPRACLAVLIAASSLAAAPVAAKPGVLATAIGAPSDLTITATVRTRVETINNQFRPSPAGNDSALSIRSALAVEYDTGAVRLGGEIWDVRAYGQSRSSSFNVNDINALEAIQAYAKIELGGAASGSSGGKGVLTLGRFTLDIGGRRLVARNRFRNTTNSFTGANGEWTTPGGVSIVALWAMPQIRLPDDAADIRANRVQWDRETTGLQFFGTNVTLPHILGGTLEGYLFRLAEADGTDRPSRNRRLWTPGFRLFAGPAAGKWDHDLEAVYQFGKARRTAAAGDLADLDVSAWFVHAEAGYTFSAGWKPRFVLLFDGASGDGGKPGKFSRFDTLFGARRADVGPTGLYGAIGRANIVSPGARLDLVLSKRTDAQVSYRAAWAQSARDTFSSTGVRDASGRSGTFAGHQIDVRLRHWLVPGVLQAETGSALLIKRGLLRAAPNAPATGNTLYGYFDLNLTL